MRTERSSRDWKRSSRGQKRSSKGRKKSSRGRKKWSRRGRKRSSQEEKWWKKVRGAASQEFASFVYRHLPIRERNIVSVYVSDRFTTDTCMYYSVCSLTIANLLRRNFTLLCHSACTYSEFSLQIQHVIDAQVYIVSKYPTVDIFTKILTLYKYRAHLNNF